MKPLPVAQMTQEDWHVWHWRYINWNDMRRLMLIDACEESDRRDAELMLDLRKSRQLCDREGVLHCILVGRETALPMWDDDSKTLMELGLAMLIPKLPGRYR